MRRNRVLASLITVALAALSIGTATAWFSDSATIRFEISAAADFDREEGAKVWVCRLIGPPDEPRVKPAKNPIHVSVNSLDAEEGFSDAHPSYVVEHGDVLCTVPGRDETESDARVAPEPEVVETAPVEEPTPSEPTTTTTSIVAETTTTTTSPSTTTTTEQATTTTVPPEDPQTTTSTVPQIDD